MDDVKRYNYMEGTLNTISSNYISMSPDDMTKNNVVLNQVLETIVKKCQETDSLFKELYRGLFYGGSYYDGLKIQKPDEYDVDIKLSIPYELYEGPLQPSNKNGYLNLRLKPVDVKNPKLWSKKYHCYRPDYGIPGHILTDFYDYYLDTEKVMLWMHRVLSTWIKGKKSNKSRISYIDTDLYKQIKVKFRRHGPAFTFRTSGFPDGRIICFDLVPCFVFGAEQWPPSGFRRNPVPDKPEFFIVPKPLPEVHKGTRYWRLSFQEQERKLLNGRDKLKPALKLIKKMRDKLSHKEIASYFIKTVFLWEVYKRDNEFWNESLSYIFMEVLKNYHKCLEDNYIGLFWYESFNLIGHIDKRILSDISRKLKYIINQLENNRSNEVLVAKYLLSRREIKQFMKSLHRSYN